MLPNYKLSHHFQLPHVDAVAYEQAFSTLPIPFVVCFHTPITLVIAPSAYVVIFGFLRFIKSPTNPTVGPSKITINIVIMPTSPPVSVAMQVASKSYTIRIILNIFLLDCNFICNQEGCCIVRSRAMSTLHINSSCKNKQNQCWNQNNYSCA